MSKDNVVELNKTEGTFDDPLTDLIRNGAMKILKEALEAEIEAFVEKFSSLKTSDGSQRLVRNGYLPERTIVTGVGEVTVKVPRARDKEAGKSDSPINFTSALIPRYLRKTKSLEELIPWLYLKGISAGDMEEALAALTGKDAKGFSQPVVSRLKSKWKKEYDEWRKRSLRGKRYVYIWADGIYCNVRKGDRQCLLVIIGAAYDGKKELIAIESGYRESELSWKEVMLDLKHRGLEIEPKLAVGDGALGFWKALRQVFPNTKDQRCWVHKTANILNKLPKKVQPKAKAKIHDIWMSETREEGEEAFELFMKTYHAKYPKATECLAKDRECLLTFYDFPAEHWRHIRSTNPIESTFATVRLRTAKVRNCFSESTVVSMAFKLCENASGRWKRIYVAKRLAEVIEGVKFVDGISEKERAA